MDPAQTELRLLFHGRKRDDAVVFEKSYRLADSVRARLETVLVR